MSQPLIPQITVLPQPQLTKLFEQARNISIGTDGASCIALITPDRRIVQLAGHRPNSLDNVKVGKIQTLTPEGTANYVVAIAVTGLPPNINDINKTIPFIEILKDLAYVGNSVVIFEGHPSSLPVALRGAGRLLVDADQRILLPKDWVEIAYHVMQTPDITYFDRHNAQNPVSKVVNEAAAARIAQSAPTTAAQYRQRSGVRVRQGDIQGAIADLEQALTIEPATIDLYVERAALWRQSGDAKAALIDLNAASRLDPKNALVQRELGTTYFYLQQWNDAVRHFTQAIRLDPTDYGSFRQRGFAYCMLQEWDRALVDSTEAIRLNPQNPIAYSDRANAWRAKDDYDQAIADCSAAIRLDPAFHYAYTNRADAKLQQGDYDGAIADCEEGVEVLKKLNSKGAITKNEFIKASDQAMALHESATAMKTSSNGVTNNQFASLSSQQIAELGSILEAADNFKKAKQYDHAIKEFSRALKILPTSTFALEHRGRARIGKKDYRGALEDFAKLAEVADTKRLGAMALAMRSLIYLEQKKPDEALAEARKALYVDPDFVEAQEILARLQSRRTGRKRFG